MSTDRTRTLAEALAARIRDYAYTAPALRREAAQHFLARTVELAEHLAPDVERMIEAAIGPLLGATWTRMNLRQIQEANDAAWAAALAALQGEQG